MRFTITLCFLLLSSTVFYAQVGIGTIEPKPSAILDITSTNAGVLIPRIALSGEGDVTTIPNPTTSLLIYNTGTTGSLSEGFVYWNGTKWVKLGAQNTTSSSSGQVMLRNGLESSGSSFNFNKEIFNTITGLAKYYTEGIPTATPPTPPFIILPTGIYEVESNLLVTSQQGIVKWSLKVDNKDPVSDKGVVSSIVGTAFAADYSSKGEGNTHQVAFINITAASAKIHFTANNVGGTGQTTIAGVNPAQSWVKIKKIQ